jgi:RNA polymerase sigma factor (sigma-70 family)
MNGITFLGLAADVDSENFLSDRVAFVGPESGLVAISDDVGSATNRDELLRKNRKLVLSIAREPEHGSYEMDDVVQLGMIGLWKAIETFDETAGTWSTWAHHKIRESIRDGLGLRRVQSGKLSRVPQTRAGADSFDTANNGPDDTAFGFDALLATSGLTAIEEKVVRLQLDNESERAIGSAVGLAKTSVRSTVASAYAKIRARILMKAKPSPSAPRPLRLATASHEWRVPTELPANIYGDRRNADVVVGPCVSYALQWHIERSRAPEALEVEKRWCESKYKCTWARYAEFVRVSMEDDPDPAEAAVVRPDAFGSEISVNSAPYEPCSA